MRLQTGDCGAVTISLLLVLNRPLPKVPTVFPAWSDSVLISCPAKQKLIRLNESAVASKFLFTQIMQLIEWFLGGINNGENRVLIQPKIHLKLFGGGF